jgi:serine/threonine-protein phosphatase 2B catalytic subunit
MPFRRGHGRQASLGTTMTSPSTRRRGLEDTISLIQGVWDGKAAPPAEGSIAEEAASPAAAAAPAPVPSA